MKEMYQKQDSEANAEVFKFSGNLFGKIFEIVIDAQQDVQSLLYDAGLQVVRAAIDEEVNRVAGKKNAHLENRTATRWSAQQGFVRVFGKKIRVRRPRVRTVDGKQEVPLKMYEAFQNDSHDREMTFKRMVRGISTRDYEGAVEGFLQGYGLSKDAVDRQFISASKKKLEELMTRRFENKAFVAVGIDGIEIGGETVVAASGIKASGEKEILGIWQGATENAEVCKTLLEDLVDRGLSTKRKTLFIIDGSKALHKAITEVFGENALIQRCQIHKRRNVRKHLPPKHQARIDRMLAAAYNMNEYAEAKEALEKVVSHLETLNASAAQSLKEGLEETLTVHKLGVTGELRKTLSNTNFVESPFSIVRHVIGRVKRWRDSSQKLRWAAAGLLEAEKRFKRVKGFRKLKELAEKLENENLISER